MPCSAGSSIKTSTRESRLDADVTADAASCFARCRARLITATVEAATPQASAINKRLGQGSHWYRAYRLNDSTTVTRRTDRKEIETKAARIAASTQSKANTRDEIRPSIIPRWRACELRRP